jgi:hypothetical protein
MTDCKNCKYTDEYCASGECTSQSPRNGSQKGDLTSQWKKGKLPSGEYYIIDALGLHTTDRYYPSHGFGAELPQSVLDKVPSYEKYLSLTYAKEEDEKIIAEYEEENAQLKDLLKECKPYIALYTENNKRVGFTPETANLLQRIKEILQ